MWPISAWMIWPTFCSGLMWLMSSVTRLSVAGSSNPVLCVRGKRAGCATPSAASADAAAAGIATAQHSRAMSDCRVDFLSGTMTARICDGDRTAATKVESERDDTRRGGARRRLADDGVACHQPREQRQAG